MSTKTKSSRKSNGQSVLGLYTPITTGGPGMKLSAWRNTDNDTSRPSYHVGLKLRGQDEVSLFGLTPARIKQLADTFTALHAQLSGPKAGDTPSAGS